MELVEFLNIWNSSCLHTTFLCQDRDNATIFKEVITIDATTRVMISHINFKKLT